jgi:hypothetical protein
MDRDEIIRLAKSLDPDAGWASDDADENCLLVLCTAAPELLKRNPDAYEDPNPGENFTRIVFPFPTTEENNESTA